MGKKVFISSPVYDLIDVRAELAAMLTGLGLTPVMSDVATTDFVVLPAANSIETCLVNVDACDYFVCVLSQRYGPRLGAAGFDNISATHLEYRRARDSGKSILFYVRDRLESDYAIWKKNHRLADMNLTWVKSPDDYGLFDLMEEHRKLRAGSTRTNWCATFQNSVDLKAKVRNHLRIPATEITLQRLIETGQVPLLDVSAELTKQWWGTPWEMSFSITWKNVGTAPGYRVLLCEPAQDAKWTAIHETPFLAPGQEMHIYPSMNEPKGAPPQVNKTVRFLTELRLPGGIKIHDQWEFHASVDTVPETRCVSHRTVHVSRRYIILQGEEQLFDIVHESLTQ
jgi:hypothetical protein